MKNPLISQFIASKNTPRLQLLRIIKENKVPHKEVAELLDIRFSRVVDILTIHRKITDEWYLNAVDIIEKSLPPQEVTK